MLDESFFVRALRETVEGDGVCEKDGKVLFVHGMLAGESGYVRVTETNKRYMRGELLSLTEASSERKEPSCPIAKSCGGCSWEHASREHELALKRKRVAECLSRIGGFSENDYCLGNTVSGRESHYRGKCEMRARNGHFGYLARTGEFIPAEECLLLSGQMNTILGILRDEQWRKIQGAVLRTNYKGETMLVLAGDEPLPKLPSDALKGAGVTSLWQLTPKKRMTHALDGRLRHIWGSERLEEEICGLRFSLSPQAFFQINREIAEKMYYDAVELAGIGRNDTVLDAYSGVGAIGMTASRNAEKVYAVEVIPEAVENARQAARENGIGNMECICGKCEEILPGDARFQELGAVFLDPPRKGCDEKLLDAVAASGAKKIVYISCDPATLARDAAFLREKGYRLESATPYDMFPKAGHVETVVQLVRKKPDTYIDINAITELEKWYAGTDAMRLLKEAMDQSVSLMDTEYHAMRLAAEAYKLDVDLMEPPVRNYKLTEKERSLSKEEQRELALSLVSDQDYQSTRTAITNDVKGCMENIISAVRDREEHAATIFEDAYLALKISAILLIALVVGVSIALRQVVVKPLKKYDDNVKAGATLPLEGAYELQQLAETYNDVYEDNLENQKLLRHEADHDALTKVFNRGAFDRLLRLYESGASDYALVMIDVDCFKTINDTYGHAVGDLVLKRIADVVKKRFRSMDYICRIGGDEFAVIMVDSSSEQKEVLSSKLNAIRKELTLADGDIPAVTLSIGIAFSDRENPGASIFKDADKTLYGVKENGRDGYAFF